MDIGKYNQEAWNLQVADGNPWTIPVGPEEIAEARRGNWGIYLTATKTTPRHWFPADLHGKDVLCLASGGGQQGPILAAAGANVTVYDQSPAQLQQDRKVAEREGLAIRTVQGDMADLSAFTNGSFDLIFHPISNCFAPEVLPVWREAYRVLRPGGVLLAAFVNPICYIFDMDKADMGEMEVRHRLPYTDITGLSEAELAAYTAKKLPLEFSHTLEEQLGGQMEAGFLLAGLFEDDQPDDVISVHFPKYIATRAIKPA